MSEAERNIADLTNSEDFSWRLRCMMALADIQAGELERESDISKTTIYQTRAGLVVPSERIRERLLLAIEKWRPGTIAMMRAAEDSMKIHK